MRKITSLILLIFAFAAFAEAGIAGYFTADHNEADSWYVKASLYEQDENFEEASKLLEAVLESVDEEYVYLKLAGIYGKLNDKEMMQFTLERGSRKMPDSAVLKGALADIYMTETENIGKAYKLYRQAYKISGDVIYAEAEARAHASAKDFNSAIKIYSDLINIEKVSDYYVQRARYFEKLGLSKEALDDYISASDLDSNFIASAKLADHYIETGDNDKAIVYLKKVIDASPDMVLAKFRLAQILSKIGKTEEAEGYFTAILDFLNESEKIYVLKSLANMAFERNEYAKAEEYFARAFEIDKDIQTAYSLAIMAESAGETATAKKWYQEILTIRPDFVEASKRLAIIYLKDGEPEEALTAVQKVGDIYQDVDYHRIVAQAYNDMGEHKKSIEVLTAAVKENPAEVKLYLDLALALDKQGDRKDAENVIKSGMKYFPDDASLLNFLGYVYAEQGVNLSDAEEMISRALKQNPEEPAYLDSMAWVYYQQGKYQKAFDYQKRALKMAPDEQELIDHMKAIMKKLGIKKSLDEVIQEN
ncbi:Tetratricopeptide TPR_2 repeat protein [Denitrovibrio acetiphilus DSM 12809]|uniref:Tetratricopeptide TPR_2 repeat protein n=1 Tax=Denitrovibrio acetiphilus (strain DSM 12809 / NBRC 114555 / N2460) TaxID=522772 RepID=D4H1C5_DENA2|nr:tetratricopeptide repeat protein [Denitrovibrio acetiphilus]ADD66873.1 Tetratricopeptide TPR_2 repeat protein [Denitrovibrio acetiphilus DSM 12809]